MSRAAFPIFIVIGAVTTERFYGVLIPLISKIPRLDRLLIVCVLDDKPVIPAAHEVVELAVR